MGPFARRSRFPKTLRGKAALNARGFLVELKRPNTTSKADSDCGRFRDWRYVAEELRSDLCVDGEKDHAFEPLSTAAKLLGVLSYGELRLHPNWDPLRSDPRFEKIVASLGPNSQWKILKRVLLQVAPR